MRRRIDRVSRGLGLALSLPALLALAGCGSDDGDTRQQSGSGSETAVRVVHAAPTAPAVDVYVEGVDAPVLERLSYGEVSAFLPVAPGTYRFAVRAAGSPADSEPVYTSDALTIAAGDNVTVIAAGLVGSSGDDAFRLLALAAGFGAAAADEAVVRIVHAGSDAPAVNIDVEADGSAELTGIERFTDSGAAGVPLPAGVPLRVGIRAGFPSQQVTSFTLPPLPAGGEIFAIATGLLSSSPSAPDGFSLLAVVGDASAFVRQDPVIFALHASPDAPTLDIASAGQVLARGLSFGNLSGVIQVAPGSYALQFYPAGFEHVTPLASGSTPALEAGQRYLAIADGFAGAGPGESPFTLLAFRDEFEDDPGNARVRLVHGSPDAPEVDIGTVRNAALDVRLGRLTYTNASAGKEIGIAPGSYVVGVAAAGQTAPLATFTLPAQAGARAFVIAAGALNATMQRRSFRLLVVNTAVFPWASAQLLPH